LRWAQGSKPRGMLPNRTSPVLGGRAG